MEKPRISELVLMAIGLVLVTLGAVLPEKLSFLVGMGILLVLYWRYHEKQKELRRKNGSLFI